MRATLDTEEEEEEGRVSEITLSTASLLGIFFGLVLVCGVFFGLGYSMGRGSSHGAPMTASTPPAADDSATVANAAAPPQPNLREQDTTASPAPADVPSITGDSSSEGAQPAAPALPAAPTPAAAAPDETASQATQGDHGSAETPVKPSPLPQPPAVVPAAPAQNVNAATPVGRPTMVQIAAVSRQEDAYALVAALRQRGFHVVVRAEPQDRLWHVQVGPFASRMEANMTRQKLLSDGYNAIIKQ